MKKVPRYDPSKFDASYYGERGNNGFGPEIHWENPLQQDELQKKWGYFQQFEINQAQTARVIKSVLFVGCARGAEVKFFQDRGIDSFGVEVSEWAVENRLPGLDGRVSHYDGINLSRFHDLQFDAVACFDVLTLLPKPILIKLGKEMQRVAGRLIVFRATFKTWQNKSDTIDGQDGVLFVAPEFYDLDEALTGDFALQRCEIDAGYSGVFWYGRNGGHK